MQNRFNSAWFYPPRDLQGDIVTQYQDYVDHLQDIGSPYVCKLFIETKIPSSNKSRYSFRIQNPFDDVAEKMFILPQASYIYRCRLTLKY